MRQRSVLLCKAFSSQVVFCGFLFFVGLQGGGACSFSDRTIDHVPHFILCSLYARLVVTRNNYNIFHHWGATTPDCMFCCFVTLYTKNSMNSWRERDKKSQFFCKLSHTRLSCIEDSLDFHANWKNDVSQCTRPVLQLPILFFRVTVIGLQRFSWSIIIRFHTFYLGGNTNTILLVQTSHYIIVFLVCILTFIHSLRHTV